MTYYNYKGFCAKYGKPKAMGAAFLAPPAINLAFQLATDASSTDILKTSPTALFIGAVGFAMAGSAHILSADALSRRNIAPEKGGRMMRQLQAGIYVGIVAPGLVFIHPLTDVFERSHDIRYGHSFHEIPQIEPHSPMQQDREYASNPAEYQNIQNSDIITVTLDVSPQTLSPAYS